MIKPEDLRRGNWVEHYGETITVDGIDDIDVFNKKCGEIPLHSITPIPLTEKILLDCGFYIDETKNASIMLPNNEVLILELNDKGIYTDYAYGTEIEYLHNLQNLHKELSKTELIIKL